MSREQATDRYRARLPLPLCVQGGSWWVQDTSSNGTFVNNEKIGRGQGKVLAVGAQLRLSLVPKDKGDDGVFVERQDQAIT